MISANRNKKVLNQFFLVKNHFFGDVEMVDWEYRSDFQVSTTIKCICCLRLVKIKWLFMIMDITNGHNLLEVVSYKTQWSLIEYELCL